MLNKERRQWKSKTIRMIEDKTDLQGKNRNKRLVLVSRDLVSPPNSVMLTDIQTHMSLLVYRNELDVSLENY